jgi:hypothetical protein
MYSFIPATFEKLAEAATALKFEDTGWKTFKRVT